MESMKRGESPTANDKIINFFHDNEKKAFMKRQIAISLIKAHPIAAEKKRRIAEEKKSIEGVKSIYDSAFINKIAGEVSRFLKENISNQSYCIYRTPDNRYYYSKEGPSENLEYAVDEDIDTDINFSELDEESLESELSDSNKKIPQTEEPIPLEDKLHPILHKYLESQKIHSKTIDHRASSKSQFEIEKEKDNDNIKREWLYPDVVGMKDLRIEWAEEIKRCVTGHDGKKIRLLSYEIKREINASNVRKAFFQTVSNSSWANQGYLVAANIKGEETEKVLRMLCDLHGIGFIKLNMDTPSKSEIKIQARERSNVDWENANSLAKVSEDFRDYLDDVTSIDDEINNKRNTWHNDVESS